MKIYCCNCRKDVEAQLVKGNIIYPHRPDLYSKNFYKCPHCGKYVGCHKGTTRPLGCIPTEALKIARQRLHAKMDPLWKSGKIRRVDLYRQISKELGYTYHNGNTKTVQECFKVYEIIENIEQDLNKSLQKG